MVMANRAATPLAIADKRATPRMSIEELNATDLDTIREKLQSHPAHDDRPAFVKVLDLLETGRNQLWATLAPTLSKRAAERGETDAFGRGIVHASEVLNELGVHNHIVRGLLGFGLDVATDPLTYIGGIGGVSRLTSAAGHTFEMLPKFAKAVRGADAAIEAGRGIDTASEVGRALAAAGHTTESVAAMAPEARAGLATRTLMGAVPEGKIAGLADRLSQVVPRFGTTREEGFLAKHFMAEGEHGGAARALVKKYGVQASPGWKIGEGGTQAFHIPLTDWNIQIPALGDAGIRNVRMAAIARGAAPVYRSSPELQQADNIVRGIDYASKMHNEAVTPEGKAAWTEAASGYATSLNDMAERIKEHGQPAATVQNANDLLAMGNKVREADAQADLVLGRGKELNSILGRRAMLDENVAQRARALAEQTSGGWNGAYAAEDHAIAKANLMRELPKEDRDLLSLSPDELHAHASEFDEVGRRMQAYQTLSNLRQGSISQYINENAHDRKLVDIAKMALGTDSDLIAAKSMTPIRSILEGVGMKDSWVYDFTHKIDDLSSKLFNRRVGALPAQMRVLNNSMLMGSRSLGDEFGQGLLRGALEIADKHGIDGAAHADEIGNLMYALAQKHSVDTGGADAAVWLTRAGTEGKEDSAFVEMLKEAQNNGLLQNQKFMEELSALAASPNGQMALKSMGELGEEGGLIGHQIPGYMPSIASPSAQEDIRHAVYNAVTKEGKAAAGGTIQPGVTKEGFQKVKDASLQYRFRSAREGFEGKERHFFHSDLPLAAEGEGDIADDVREYLSMPDRPEPKYVEPMEMNRYVREGRFAPLTMGKRPEEFFDTNYFTLMASRVAAHERAAAKRSAINWLSTKGVSEDASLLQGKIEGKPGLGNVGTQMRMRDGSLATIEHRKNLFGTTVYGVNMRGDFYRPLSAEAGALKDNPILMGLGLDKLGSTRIFQHDIANAIEGMADATSAGKLGQALNWFDSATQMWKSAAIFRPGFLIANLIGDGLNAMAGGARAQDFLRHSKDMIRVVMNEHNPEALRGIEMNIGGQRLDGEQVWEMLRKHRVTEAHQMADVGLNAVGRRWMALPSSAEPHGLLATIQNPVRAGKLIGRDFTAAAERIAAGSGMANPTAMHKYLAGDYVLDDRLLQWFFSPWMRVNQKVANWQRGLAFLSHMEQGHDAESAARATIRSLFDYSDASKVERTYFKRIFPFWSWIRNNGAYQMDLLLRRPIYAGSLPLLKNAIEEMAAGDDRLPEYMRPNWMREQMAMQIGQGEDRMFFLPRSMVPSEQMAQFLEPITGAAGAQDFMHYFANSLNPLGTKPLEFATGHEFFSGRSIGTDPLTSEVTSGGILTDLIPPIGEAGKVVKATRDRGAAAGAERFLLGGRIQAGGDERLHRMKLRDFKEEEEALRRTITRSEGDGDHATSVKARVRQFQLWKRMEQAGFENEVPQWARRQLTALAPEASTR